MNSLGSPDKFPLFIRALGLDMGKLGARVLVAVLRPERLVRFGFISDPPTALIVVLTLLRPRQEVHNFHDCLDEFAQKRRST